MIGTVDVVVVGGGIAGVSAAYHLSATHRVVLFEAAPQLAYHSTGRSAALLVENYGAEPIRPLTKASRRFLTDPPSELVDGSLVEPRGVLWLGNQDQEESLDEVETGARLVGSVVERWTTERAIDAVPALRQAAVAAAVYEPGPLDIDVAGLHQAFVRGIRRSDGELLTSAPVTALTRESNGWRVEAGDKTLFAKVVVNAAGAWGDQMAQMAGVEPVGLTPMRRTAFMVPGKDDWSRWPMVIDADHRFYFKPDGVQVLCSPADETPVEPCDARPDELDVARAIDRINTATTLNIRSVRSAWAGLRTFSPDRSMVIGPDPAAPEFVWLVGQGGTGIQTAPAAGELVAAQVRGEGLPTGLAEHGVDPEALAVARLR